MIYLLEEAMSNLRYGGLVNILSATIIMLTIVILSALILVTNYIHGELGQLKDEPAIIAFIDDSLDDTSAQKLRTEIEKLEHVKSVTFVSKAEALGQRSKMVFGDQADIVEDFRDINPLPASLEIKVLPNSMKPNILEELAEKVKRYEGEGVEDVVYEKRSSDFIRKTEMVIIGLTILLSSASIVIVCFTIMLTAYFRREEIRIMKLVGATYWYIRIPLILQGVTLGITGSILGMLAFYAIFNLYVSKIGSIPFLPLKQILLIIMMGVLLGLIGGITPVRKYVNV